MIKKSILACYFLCTYLKEKDASKIPTICMLKRYIYYTSRSLNQTFDLKPKFA